MTESAQTPGLDVFKEPLQRGRCYLNYYKMISQNYLLAGKTLARC